jgi:hypothetical protein
MGGTFRLALWTSFPQEEMNVNSIELNELLKQIIHRVAPDV